MIDFVRCWGGKTELPAGRFIDWLGVSPSKFYDWRKRCGKVNEHNAWIPHECGDRETALSNGHLVLLVLVVSSLMKATESTRIFIHIRIAPMQSMIAMAALGGDTACGARMCWGVRA